MRDRKIIYTESGKLRFDKFHKEVTTDLEEYLIERKLIPGDDFIEVTAADIDEVAQKFKIIRNNRSTSIKTMIPLVYSVVGVILTLVGLFYEEFKSIVEGNPQRLIFIISGITMIFVSWGYLYLIRIREKREHFERHIQEIELRRNEIRNDEK